MTDRRPPHHLEHLYCHSWYAPHQAWLKSRGAAAHHPTLDAEPERLVARGRCLWKLSLTGAILSGADLSGAKLSMCDLSYALLPKVDLYGASINDCKMDHTVANKANLENAYVSNTSLISAWIQEANLQSATIIRCWIDQANLRGSNMTKCKVAKCTLAGTRLTSAILEDARISGVVTSGGDNRISCMSVGGYNIVIFDDQMAIGCKQKSINEWLALSDDEIKRLAPNAIEWNSRFKPVLLELLRALGKI